MTSSMLLALVRGTNLVGQLVQQAQLPIHCKHASVLEWNSLSMGQVGHVLDQLDLLSTELSNANRRLPLGM